MHDPNVWLVLCLKYIFLRACYNRLSDYTHSPTSIPHSPFPIPHPPLPIPHSTDNDAYIIWLAPILLILIWLSVSFRIDFESSCITCFDINCTHVTVMLCMNKSLVLSISIYHGYGAFLDPVSYYDCLPYAMPKWVIDFYLDYMSHINIIPFLVENGHAHIPTESTEFDG